MPLAACQAGASNTSSEPSLLLKPHSHFTDGQCGSAAPPSLPHTKITSYPFGQNTCKARSLERNDVKFPSLFWQAGACLVFIGVIPPPPPAARILWEPGFGGHAPPGAGAPGREGAKLNQVKSKRSALAAGINTSLWVASADTSRREYRRETRQPGAERGWWCRGCPLPPPRTWGRGRCAPRTRSPHVAGPHMPRRRAGTAHTRGHAGTRRPGHTREYTHARTDSAFAGARERRASPSLGHPVLPLAGGSWRAARRGARGEGLPGAGGARPAVARAGMPGAARYRRLLAGGDGAGPPGAARRQ